MFQKFSPEKYFLVSALGSKSLLQTYAWWLSVWILWTSARHFSNCQKCRVPNIWQGYMAMSKAPKIYKVPTTTTTTDMSPSLLFLSSLSPYFLLGWHLTIQAVCKPLFNSTNVYCALHIRYRSRYLLNKTDNKDMKITTHLLEWPKSGILTIPNVDTEVELQKFSCIADENAKWHFAREYGVSYKTKHTLTTVC